MATQFDRRRWQTIAEWTAEHRVPEILARCSARIAPLETEPITAKTLDAACQRACDVLVQAVREGLIQPWEAPRVAWLTKGDRLLLCFSRSEVPADRLITGPGGHA
jgi:hypothetical protein